MTLRQDGIRHAKGSNENIRVIKYRVRRERLPGGRRAGGEGIKG
jgi:hypothetical protein